MKQHLLPIFIIIFAVIVIHGSSIDNCLLLDDFNHRAELQEGGWSFRSLVEASHLGGQRYRVRMWWQEDADLYFFRPVAFFFMRLQYVVGSWQPAVMHVFSLVWACFGATMVMLIAHSFLKHRGWATLAGVLFAIHPANYLTIGWIACQNELMMSAFLLLAMFCYGRYSGWYDDGRQTESNRNKGDGHVIYFVVTVICFIAALGCRENGVVLPLLLILGDYIVRPERFKGRIKIYVILGAILVAYFVIRHLALGEITFPKPPYAYPYDKPGFAGFVIDKFIYYTLGLYAYFPIVGFEWIIALRDQSFLFYGTFAIMAFIWLALLWYFRSRRILLLWVLVAAIPLIPVLPVFASSHHVYFASAGMVLASIIAANWLFHLPIKHASGQIIFRSFVSILIVIHLIGFTVADVIYYIGLAGFSTASQLPAKEVINADKSFHPGDTLFFINLPMLGFNCMPEIEQSTGVSPLTGYVLTFAPAMIAMEHTSQILPVRENQLLIRFEDPGYFSGIIGKALLEAMGRDVYFSEGETFTTPEFNVEITDVGDDAVHQLKITFRKPLDDPSYHFFIASPRFSAYPINFRN